MSLSHYRDRRDFCKSPEPPDGTKSRWSGDSHPIFVIQKHAASTTHFDLRLEWDGELISWAVPKGPSTDPREKRLAVRVENHPLDYADFEGVIPEGEYGAGAVIVWDAGPYRVLDEDDEDPADLGEALNRGAAEFWVEGKKIRGGFALVHAKIDGDDRNWLLIKKDDDGADARRNPVSTEPESVLSGRTLEQVAERELPRDPNADS